MNSILDLAAAAGRVATSLVPKSLSARDLPGAALASGSPAAATGTVGPPITSKDFMTLLVTEMKNQDPTKPTDPNQYIQQLVGINSLQQLIAINGALSGSKKP